MAKTLIEKAEFHRRYDNGDGSFTLESHAGPIHYQDENGEWQDVDATIQPDQPWPVGAETQFMAASHKASFGSREGADTAYYHGLRDVAGNRFSRTLLAVTLDGAGSDLSGGLKNKTLDSANNQLTADINADIAWVSRHGRISNRDFIKIIKVCHDFTVQKQFILTGLSVGNALGDDGNYVPDADGRFFLVDSSGTIKFWIPLPVVIASNGNAMTIQHTLSSGLVYTKSLSDDNRARLAASILHGKDLIWPLLTDTTTTFYSLSSDGNVDYSADFYALGFPLTWAQMRAGTGGGTASTDATNTTDYACAEYFSGVYGSGYVRRLFFAFDTSAIGAGNTVTAATVNLYCSAVGYPCSLSLMKGTQADTLTTADFNAFTGSEYGHVTPAANSWLSWSPTLADVSITGKTKVCLREYGHDYSNVAPLLVVYEATVDMSEHSGTTYDPYISVTYTAGGGGPVDPGLFTFNG